MCIILIIVFAVAGYGIFTFNIKILIGLFLIMVVQKLIGHKNKVYVAFVSKICKLTSYFNKFETIYEEEPSEETRMLYCYHPHSVLPYGKEILI